MYKILWHGQYNFIDKKLLKNMHIVQNVILKTSPTVCTFSSRSWRYSTYSSIQLNANKRVEIINDCIFCLFHAKSSSRNFFYNFINNGLWFLDIYSFIIFLKSQNFYKILYLFICKVNTLNLYKNSNNLHRFFRDNRDYIERFSIDFRATKIEMFLFKQLTEYHVCKNKPKFFSVNLNKQNINIRTCFNLSFISFLKKFCLFNLTYRLFSCKGELSYILLCMIYLWIRIV